MKCEHINQHTECHSPCLSICLFLLIEIESKPIKDKDDNDLLTKEEKSTLTTKNIKRLREISRCARDHYLIVVKNLMEDQLKQRYPLACKERWRGDHHLSEKYAEEYEGAEDGPQ